MQVDFLFKGSHPAFFWAAALLKQKGKTVAFLPDPSIHSWEIFPAEVLPLLGIESLKTDRDQNPIQILTGKCRMSIFADLALSKKDLTFCTGNTVTPELNRGLSFYAKGSDYPVVFGESPTELLEASHRMEYFDLPPGTVESAALAHLKKIGVSVLLKGAALPTAEQTITLDLSRAKVFRTKFVFTLPLKTLPVGASNRMLFVQRNSPVIEMIHLGEKLQVRTLLPVEPLLTEKMIGAIRPYFLEEQFDLSQASVVPEQVAHQEWGEAKSHVDSSKPGQWLISPAINPELGERSLYVRLSELLTKKFKKQPIFTAPELFSH